MAFKKIAGDACWLCGPDRFALNRAVGLVADKTRVGSWQHWDVAIDIAPLMVGHLLASPKRHLDRFEQLSGEETEELGRILNWLSSNLATENKELVAFAHCTSHDGPSQCISHAHLHILPVDKIQQASLDDMLIDKGFLVSISDDAAGLYENPALLSYLLIFHRAKWIAIVGDEVAARLRTDAENLIAGTSKPWRRRLVDDEDGVRDAIFRTMQKIATYV